MLNSAYIVAVTTLALGLLGAVHGWRLGKAARAHARAPLRDSEFHVRRWYLVPIFAAATMFCGVALHFVLPPLGGEWEVGNIVFATPFFLLGLLVATCGAWGILRARVTIREGSICYHNGWRQQTVRLSEIEFVSLGVGNNIVITTSDQTKTVIPAMFAGSGELLGMLQAYQMAKLLERANAAARKEDRQEDAHKD